MAVKVTCYGAVREIGGNKILLQDGGASLMLDFGTPFGRSGQFYNEFLRPRSSRGLLDPLMLGLLPDVRGIYRADLEMPDLWQRVERHFGRPAGQARLDAVLLSHAHLDHNGDLSYLDEQVPVYATRASAMIGRVMQVTGGSTMEREMVYVNPRMITETGDLAADRNAAYRLRPHAFLDGELAETAQDFWLHAGGSTRKGIEPAPAQAAPAQVAGLELRWWPVDHSIPGACGFALRTSAGWVAYTGDIRFHGRQAERSWQFMRGLAELQPRVLICEGTHLTPERRITEEEIAGNVLPLLRGYAGRLVIADFGPRNLERLEIFLELSRQTGRILLAQPKDIYLLRALALGDPQAYAGLLQHPNLGMYADVKSSPGTWEKDLRQEWQARTTDAAEISRRPGEFLLAFSLWDLNDLIDLDVARGGAYFFSNSKAYDDEQKADLERLRAWVGWLGLELVGDPEDPQRVAMHASGHASGAELLEFVRTIQPHTLLPVHCERPEWWQQKLAGSPIRIAPPRLGEAQQFD